jgi:hypothetical protein
VSQPKNPLHMNQGAIIIVVVLVVAIAVFLTFTRPALKRLDANGGQPTLTPASPSLSQKELTRKFEIRESSEVAVNAVQAKGTYPADQLEYVGVDGVGSSFAVTAESKGANGQFSVARGSIHPTTGDHLVATLVFKLKSPSASPTVSLGSGSALVESTNSTNLLPGTAGHLYVKAIK